MHDRCAWRKIASRKKLFDQGECVFVGSPQLLEASRENSYRYDKLVSGRSVYLYVGGNPVSGIDPSGHGVVNVITTAIVIVLSASLINKAVDAYNSMNNRTGPMDIINTRDEKKAGEALAGQEQALNDAAKVGEAGSELVYRNPISTAEKWWIKTKDFCKGLF